MTMMTTISSKKKIHHKLSHQRLAIY